MAKLRGKSAFLAVLFTTGLLLNGEPSSADVYIGGPPDSGTKADTFDHTYCWGGSFGATALRNAATNAMNNLDTQTLYTDTFTSSCSSLTDVVWESSTTISARGDQTCLATNSVGECEQSRLRLNPNQLTDDINRRKTACHELGHSVGLTHDPGCMVSGAVSVATETYTSHHVSHMNASNESPWGAVDEITRVTGGIRVRGWALDPDLRLGPTEVHVYIDVTGHNLGLVSQSRTDVAGVYPYWGGSHGFNTVLPVGAGPNKVCVYAINASGTGGSNQLIRCQTV